jgi:hypothetical protein
MKRKLKSICCLVVILLVIQQKGFAQFQQLPIQKNTSSKINNPLSDQRIKENKLKLPFWDDFSTGIIDNIKWVNEGAHVSLTTSNAAPTLGALVLDGINTDGRPYSNITLQEGIADVISSQPIDLSSNVYPKTPENVYISFFWQAGGKGELPDFDDYLLLQFLNSEGSWENIWQVNGGNEAQRLFFSQVLIKIDPKFFHENFQFRFQMRGKLSGPFDSWLLDYVYVNSNRSSNDLFTEDRSLSRLTSLPFKKYAAIPLFELKKHQEKYLTSIDNEFKNLNNRFRAMDFTVQIRNKQSQAVILTINNKTPFNPVPLSLERRTFKSNVLQNIPLPDSESNFEILTFLSTGDGLLTRINGTDTTRFENVNFKVNDTIKVDLPLKDFFAYDNGHADYAAGINQRSGMLAVRYEMNSSAYLKGLSINFTNTAQKGAPIDILVWKELSKEPIYVGTTEIPENSRADDFSYFEFDENISVSGIFYVGFMQFTNNFLYVGLDKSNDSGKEIFYNVTGNWEQNEFVEGSLMIRPHLSETPIIRNNQSNELHVLAYPNPVTEKLFLEGEFEIMGIYDSFGRKVNVPTALIENKKELNFTGFNKGIYLVTVNQNQTIKTLRVLVK